MSTSFTNRFFSFFNIIFDNKLTKEVKKSEVLIKFGVLTTFLSGHGIYAVSTSNKDQIIVTKKYKMNKSGYTNFMIIDNKGNHYNVNNSFWYWKWNSIEDWHKIEENKQIFIKYYGWRLPLLGLFPNVYLSNQAEFLDSMSRAEFIVFESNLNKKTN